MQGHNGTLSLTTTSLPILNSVVKEKWWYSVNLVEIEVFSSGLGNIIYINLILKELSFFLNLFYFVHNQLIIPSIMWGDVLLRIYSRWFSKYNVIRGK